MVESHGSKRDPDRRRGGLEKPQMRGHELPTVIAQRGNARDDSLALHDRHPHDRTWFARKDVLADRSIGVVSDWLNGIKDLVAGSHQAPKQRRLGYGHRAEHSDEVPSRAGEAHDVASRFEVNEHDVGRGVVDAHSANYRV